MKTAYDDIKPYRTKDGSFIRELMHPEVHGNRNLSFAEAIIEPGISTVLHKHETSEEIYHVIQGAGVITLGDESFPIRTGDTICIAPNKSHCVKNTGIEPLKIYCCCSPPYSHKDTKIGAEMP